VVIFLIPNYIKAYWVRHAPTGLTFNNCTLCPHCIYVLCVYLGTNRDLCHLQHKLIGFYNRDEMCLPRGADWAFNTAVCSMARLSLQAVIPESERVVSDKIVT
jgi:hypothetical protein